MLKLNQAIIVEGKYDKIKLSSIIDALIIEVNGFQIFKNKETIELIKLLSSTCGIIIMTDSDSAGMLIRNRITQIAKDGLIYQAYVPEILGKERRKSKPSSEGILGVEGVNKECILLALNRCGIKTNECASSQKTITTLDLYNLGLTGKQNSKELRHKVLKELNLPKNISKNNLLKILHNVTTLDKLKEICDYLGGK